MMFPSRSHMYMRDIVVDQTIKDQLHIIEVSK